MGEANKKGEEALGGGMSREKIWKELDNFRKEIRYEWDMDRAKSKRERGIDRKELRAILEKIKAIIRKLSLCRSTETETGQPQEIKTKIKRGHDIGSQTGEGLGTWREQPRKSSATE